MKQVIRRAARAMIKDAEASLLNSDNVSISAFNYGVKADAELLEALRAFKLPGWSIEIGASFLGYIQFLRKPKE